MRGAKKNDKIIPQLDKNKQKIVSQLNVDAIVVGSDWKGKYPPVTCDMIYFDYTNYISSSYLRKKIK